ncbi:MAG: GntR family transcriptional regulator [Candidatus Methanomethyliaceae archaeon]|nr:GntR family transcriptional regulator [Candidatus Methanomethyliaceae archaeon]MDW7970774.1 hypothetical protein [Nitrososphaerota archaeon]
MSSRSIVRKKLLEILKIGDYVPQSHLHKSLKISRSRVSEILSELEREGLVTRIKMGNQYLIKLLDSPIKEEKLRDLKIGIVWSSEYPFLSTFAKRVKEKLNIIITPIVFTNSIQATKALVLRDVDLALTPTITQLYFYAIFKNFKIIGGGAYGGCKVLVKDSIPLNNLYSSELSTMDLVRFLAIREKILPQNLNTWYFRNPGELINASSRGLVKYAIVWHPIYKKLESYGYRELLRGEELELQYCCTLAASNSIPIDLRKSLAELYRSSLEEYVKAPENWMDWYAIRTGIPRDVLMNGVKEYKINPYLDENQIINYASKASIKIPDVNSIVSAALN